jgi:phage terminase Nu1 subunit (DNA packaging protein)
MSIPSTCTSEELRLLTGYSKAAIIALEQQAVIARVATNAWALPGTLVALIKHLRERRPAVSTERTQFERARAQREQMKAEQMAGQLCRVSDFREAIDDVYDQLIPRLDALPARVTRDLDLRKKWNEEIRQLRTEVADYCRKRAAELGGGEAAP